MRIRVLAVVVVAAGVIGACGGGSRDKQEPAAPTVAGPVQTDADGLQTGPPPWQPEYAHLKARLDKDGIPALRVEGTTMDLHVFVAVAYHGRQATVPALIGVNGQEESGRIVSPPDGFVSPLHTHDATGLIHVHSPVVRTYTVGEVFDVWGVRFSATCLGVCAADGQDGQDDRIRVFDNGKERTGDPRAVALEPLHVYVVTFGTEAEVPSSIPSKFPGT